MDTPKNLYYRIRSGRDGFFLTSAKLAQLNFSPTVAYKISEKFSIGAGPVITYATMKRSIQIGLAPLGFPAEGELNIQGEGWPSAEIPTFELLPEGGSPCPTYRKPFDLIAETVKTKEWLT